MKYATVLQKALEPEEVRWWVKFLSAFSLAEIEYSFENWARNNQFFPRPADVKALCDAYRLSNTYQPDGELPIGCERCEWTGFYQVRRVGVERTVAPCPCRQNVSLRTKDTRVAATRDELRALYEKLNSFGIAKVIEKPKQVSGVIPTTKELAEQLDKNGHVRFIKGGRND